MKKLLYFSIVLFATSCNPSFEKDGGTRITLEAKNADKEQMDRTMHILTQRLEAVGLKNVNIRIGDSPERIVVEIPGIFDNQRMRGFLQSSAKLEFWETYDNKEMYGNIVKLNTSLSEELFPDLKDTVEEAVKEPEAKNLEGASLDEQFAAQKSDKEIEEDMKRNAQKKNPLFALLNPAIQNDGRTYVLMQGPVVGMAIVKDTSKINSYFNSPTAKKIFDRSVKFLWTLQPMRESNQEIYQLVAIKVGRSGKAVLWDNVIADAHVVNDDYGQQISMTMTKLAGFEWQKLTRENIGKAIAIVLDNQVYSYPIVQSEISGGMASITGDFSEQEAQDFANVMKAGCLPVAIRIVAEEVVASQK